MIMETKAKPLTPDDLVEKTVNELQALLLENSAQQFAITAALVRRQRAEREIAQDRASMKWITVEQAVERSALSPRFCSRRADEPNFGWIRRLSNRTIRVSAAALEDFMMAKGKRR